MVSVIVDTLAQLLEEISVGKDRIISCEDRFTV